MTYEIDHIFILADPHALSADKLVHAGITEGASNIHQGQGTANRRFFFNNSMLEFMWVHDEAETISNRTQPTHLLPRWQGRSESASPFGICFRPTSDEINPPFPSWDYTPQYLPEGLAIQIADTVNQLEEPFLFFASWIKAPTQEITHEAGLENITAIDITHPYADLSSPSIDAIQHLVMFKIGDSHLLTVTFDNHRQGKILDLQPNLPIIIQY